MPGPKHHLIYVPGLGDSYDRFRKKALKLWRLFGVSTELVAMDWSDRVLQFEDRFKRVEAAIEQAVKNGYKVSLIGESAGGSMSLNVLAEHPDLHKVITLAGVDNPNTEIAHWRRQQTPGFVVSVHKLAESVSNLPLQKIHTISALYDETVHHKNSVVAGAHNHRWLSFGHLVTILLALTIFSPLIIRIAKKT